MRAATISIISLGMFIASCISGEPVIYERPDPSRFKAPDGVVYGSKHAYVFGEIGSKVDCGQSRCECEEMGGCDCLGEDQSSGLGEGASLDYRFSVMSLLNWVVCDTGSCVAAKGPEDTMHVAVADFTDVSDTFLEFTGARYIGFGVSKNVSAGAEPILRNMYLDACEQPDAEWIAGPGAYGAVLGEVEVCDLSLIYNPERPTGAVVNARPGISWRGPEDGWRMEPIEGSIGTTFCWARKEFDAALDGLTTSLVSDIDTPSTQIAGCDTVLSEYDGTSAITCTGVPSTSEGESNP